MASTPSPGAELPQTPPAPRLGYHDTWEPWPSRKSARISQRDTDRTPSPRASHLRKTRSPRRTVEERDSSASASPMPSPQKKRQPAADSVRRASGSLTAEGTANAAAALGLANELSSQKSRGTTARAANMLPTPSKTPRKPTSGKQSAEIDSIKRNLFSSNQSSDIGTPQRKAKKYSGMTMESFRAEDVEDPIEIFTDSQDRIPERDNSASNPFYGHHAPEPTRLRNTRKRVAIRGEGSVTIEDASRRDDGMLYNFRGKTFFRKFGDDGEEQPDEQEASGDAGSRLTRPLTRSSVKPRLLWRPEPKSEEALEEEEAATDVEDAYMDDAVQEPQTPKKVPQMQVETPEAPKYAPVSPPDTRRTTRSANKLADEETPVKKTRGRQSPFDIWQVTKERKPSPAKRQADNVAQGPAKRTRA